MFEVVDGSHEMVEFGILMGCISWLLGGKRGRGLRCLSGG